MNEMNRKNRDDSFITRHTQAAREAADYIPATDDWDRLDPMRHMRGVECDAPGDDSDGSYYASTPEQQAEWEAAAQRHAEYYADE